MIMLVTSIILNVLLAAVFLFSGGRKVVGGTAVTGEATHLGLPPTGYRAIGVAEVAAAVALLVGLVWAPLGIAAAAGLVLLMPGAVIAHVRAGDGPAAWAPAIVLTVVVAVALVLGIATR
jgi:uncharacterized membrane protein YphA (DoxX/SURF4 family)